MEDYVISYAKEEYKKFSQEVNYNLKQLGINASVFDFVKGNSMRDVLFNNRCNYLKTNENYIQLQNNLRETSISFDYNDIKSKYDLIYLSNIRDYFRSMYYTSSESIALSSSLELLQEIYDKNLNKPGEILLAYFDSLFVREALERKKGAKRSPIRISCTKKVRYIGAAGLEKGKVLWKNQFEQQGNIYE